MLRDANAVGMGTVYVAVESTRRVDYWEENIVVVFHQSSIRSWWSTLDYQENLSKTSGFDLPR